MTAFHLTAHDLALAAGWLAAGTVIGAIYFLSLRWNLRMIGTSHSLLSAVAVQLARFIVLGIALASVVRTFGALPLLAATLGILAARTIIVRRKA